MTSRLSSLLVQDGLVSAKRMADAFQRQVIYGGTLDTNLLEMRVVEEEVLLNYLGRAAGLPTQPAGISAMGRPSGEVLQAFPREVAERFRAVPAESTDGGVLRVLVADPVEPQDMEALAQTLNQRIEPWICPEFRIMEAMDIVYGATMPPRFGRLLNRSRQSFEGKATPAPRLIDPVPRFGNLHDFHLEPASARTPPAEPPLQAAPPAPAPEQVPAPESPREPPAAPAEAVPAPEAQPEESVDESTVVEEFPASSQPVSGPQIAAVPEAIREHSSPVRPVKVAVPPEPPKPTPRTPPPAPVPASAPPSAGGGKKKKKRRGEAPKVPPAAPIIAKPVVIAPARPEQRDPKASPRLEPARPAAASKPPEPKVVVEPSVVVTDLPTESSIEREWRQLDVPALPGALASDQSARPMSLRSQEHTPLPSPLPPPEEFSGPNPSLGSGAHAAAPAGAGSPQAESIPVPIDSGRLGEQIIHGHPAVAAPAAEEREPPRVAVAIGGGRTGALSFEAAREIIAGADDRDVIFEALCRAARSRVAFAAVFTVHGDVAFGRTALGDEWFDRQALGKVAVPLDRPSAFRIAVKGRAPYVGRIGDQPAVGDPLSSIGRKPPLQGAVMPVLVRGRPVALLYLDDVGRELRANLSDDMRPLLQEVSQAFQRLVLRSRAGGFVAPESPAARGRVQDELLAPDTSAWRSAERDKQKRTTLARFTPTTGSQRVIEVRDQPRSAAEGKGPATDKDLAAPQESREQPTTRLRADASKKDRPAEKATPIGRIDLQRQPAAPAPAPEEARPEPAEPAVAPPAAAEPKRPAAAEDLTDLLSRAGAGEQHAAEELLRRGEAGAWALVQALPGPVKSRERQSLRDPIGEPVFARGPLLALALRFGRSVIEPLLARLQEAATPPEVRYYLALCFSELSDPRAGAVLGPLLFDGDDPVRMAAVTALRAQMEGPELRDLLETLRGELLGPDVKRQIQAIEALGELRDVQAVPRILQLVVHRDPLLSDAAVRAMTSLSKQDFGKSRLRWRMWWQRHQAEPRLQWMLNGLSHQNAAIRASAQDELRALSGDVAGYRFDLPRRERERTQQRWVQWWQRRGYPVHAP